MVKQRQPCIIYARVVGWITPVRNFNKGKKAEYEDRLEYEVNEEDYAQ